MEPDALFAHPLVWQVAGEAGEVVEVLVAGKACAGAVQEPTDGDLQRTACLGEDQLALPGQLFRDEEDGVEGELEEGAGGVLLLPCLLEVPAGPGPTAGWDLDQLHDMVPERPRWVLCRKEGMEDKVENGHLESVGILIPTSKSNLSNTLSLRFVTWHVEQKLKIC